MDEIKEEYKHFETVSINRANLGEDGYWVIDAELIQGRSVDGKDWERRRIESSARSQDPEVAVKDALTTMTIYLQSINGDLFSAPEVENVERMN